MESIGVRELRQNASRYLARVKAGESFDVTDRGALVARLVPPTKSESARDRLIAEGRLIPAKRAWTRRPLHPNNLPGGITAALEAERAERL